MICSMSCKSAMVESHLTRRRLQMIGLIPSKSKFYLRQNPSTQSEFRDYLTREEHNCPNRRVRNRMHGGVGGRGCKVPSYPDHTGNDLQEAHGSNQYPSPK